MPKTSRRNVSIQEALGSRYKIIQRIATGGFADVFLAEHTQLGRKVAIKVLLPELAAHDDVVKRFQRESRWAAQLSHPNIIDIYDVGEGENEDERIYYFVMKFVEGETLAQRMDREHRIPPADAVHIVKQLASALAYADQHSVVHRDIKPSNVMLDNFGKPILMDFGVARVQYEGRFTKKGTLMGTPHYLAPEQPLGKPVDGRSDIYGLGIMFYEMLSGNPPFQDDDPVAVIFKHVNETAMPLGRIAPELSPRLCEIVHKMIEKLPERRYQSAGEVVDDLEALTPLYPVPTPATGWKTPRPIQPERPLNQREEAELKKSRDTAGTALKKENLPAAIQSMTKALEFDSSSHEMQELLRMTEEKVMEHVNQMCERLDFDGAQHLLRLAKDAFPQSVESKSIVVERSRLLHEKVTEADRLYKEDRVDLARKKYQDFLETPAIYDFGVFHDLRKRAEDTLQLTNLAGDKRAHSMPRIRQIILLAGAVVAVLTGLLYISYKAENPEIQPQHGGITLKKKPPSVQPENVGKLHIDSDPAGASIFIGGVEKGIAPLEIADLPYGKHVLEAKLKGYKDLRQDLEINGEHPDVEVSITLEPAEPAMGSILIQSTPPGATIRIGDKVVGETPRTIPHSPAGKYTVTLNKEGFEPYTHSLRVYKDQAARLDALLVPMQKKVAETKGPVLAQVELTPGKLVTLDPDIIPPKPIVQTAVRYPDEARARSLEGVVRLSILVSETGKVIDAKVVQSADPLLDKAATTGVREWTYAPATKHGAPVSVWIPVSITFVKS